MPTRPSPFPLQRLWPVLLLLAACRDPKIVAYRIAKEKDPAPAPASAESPPALAGAAALPAKPDGNMTSTPVVAAAGAALAWTAPASWQAKPLTPMRKGSYMITGPAAAAADLSITAFPGDVGGEIANVNRWRGQLGQAPLPDAEAPATITRLEANGLKVAVVDLTGTSGGVPSRLVGAMVPFGGATWFFKLLGPAAVVAKEKPAFIEFLKSVQPAAPAP